MDVQKEILCIARNIQNRPHKWESEETPQGKEWGLCTTSSYDRPIEYALVAIRAK